MLNREVVGRVDFQTMTQNFVNIHPTTELVLDIYLSLLPAKV
jgi:hypothetical protein